MITHKITPFVVFRESVNMKRRSTANIETETNREAHNISASIKDSKDSKEYL